MPRRIIEECANCNGQGDARNMFQYKGVMVCSDRCADDWAEWLLDKEWEAYSDETYSDLMALGEEEEEVSNG